MVFPLSIEVLTMGLSTDKLLVAGSEVTLNLLEFHWRTVRLQLFEKQL